MTATVDPNYHLDAFSRTALEEHGDGWRSATQWLATGPARIEVIAVARIWRDLHDGGFSGCDTATYDATHCPSFIEWLKGSPNRIQVFDGVEEMAAINMRQGTNYPAWPKRAFSVSFDSGFWLGFAAACDTAVRMR